METRLISLRSAEDLHNHGGVGLMVADDVIETASDGLVLRAVTGILSDQHELDRLAGVRIDDGCVRIQGTLSITSTELFLMMPLTSIQVAAAAVPTNTRVAAIAAATAVLT